MKGRLADLIGRHAAPGRVVWIGLRPGRRMAMREAAAAEIGLDGLVGDRRGAPGPRAVTLIQAEHLPVIRALSGAAGADFAALRRNIGVAGINVAALKGAEVEIGTAVLQVTGVCAPCSRMEEALGPGGYNAMRGHGGVTCAVIRAGIVAVGSTLTLRV